MTGPPNQAALRSRLEEVLGQEHAATLMTMLPRGDDLATNSDLAAVRDDLKGEISSVRDELRGEISSVRDELRADIAGVRSELGALQARIEHRYATKDDLLELRRDFDVSLRSFVRTFIATQAATVVGMTGIFYALVRLT